MSIHIGRIAAGVFFATFGITLAVAGVMLFQQILAMEAAGNVQGLSSRTNFLYTYLGKWGVFAVYEVAGMSLVLAAIDKARAALRWA